MDKRSLTEREICTKFVLPAPSYRAASGDLPPFGYGLKLWEVHISASSGISRAIYVATGKRVVIVRVFVKKKTQKTPQRELELARQRAKDVT